MYLLVGTRLVGKVYGFTSCCGVPQCAVASVGVFIALVWHVWHRRAKRWYWTYPARYWLMFHRHPGTGDQ